MSYYYKQDSSDVSLTRNELKEKLKPKALEILPGIQKIFDEKITIEFALRNTFGWVFTDFEKDYRGRLIGKGEKDLYDMIKDEYKYIVLSRNIKDDYSEPISFPDGKILRLNIDNFRETMRMGNTKKLVGAFLKHLVFDESKKSDILRRLDETGELQRQITLERVLKFVEKYPKEKIDDLQKIVSSIESTSDKFHVKPANLAKILEKIDQLPPEYTVDAKSFSKLIELIEKTPENFIITSENTKKMIGMISRFSKEYKIDDPDDFEKLVDSFIKVFANYDIKQPTNMEKMFEIANTMFDYKIGYFEKTLKEFDEKIKSNIDEEDLRDFIFKHIWLLDFKYIFYKKKKEERLPSGDADVTLYKNRLAYEEAYVIEFKRADDNLVSEKERKSPVILAKVGKALSQATNYLEDKKKPGVITHGIVIIGRKKEIKDYFIDKFNQYLHGIEIITFDDLYEKANNIIKAIKQENSSTENV